MSRFRDLPIRRKLLLMTFASSVSALTLAAGGFLAWDVLQFRRELRTDLTAQARIVSENTSTALAFGDERVAGENLAILQLRPHIVTSCLYDERGALFAAYHRDPGSACQTAPPEGTAFAWDRYEIVQDVVFDNRRVGRVFIHRDLDDVYERLEVGAATVIGLLLLAIGAAFLIAARMQRSIASPLLHLAETARTISTTRDYSLRAVPVSNDEMGVVVHAFNDMLDRIAERTTELSKANADLEHEVEVRRRAEAERTAALERERDANRLKDEFLATLSHELRTPLNAVLGWTRVLRSARVEPATAERALESIERNARAQARLIEDLLEISRIVTGKLRLQVEETDMAAIVDAAVEVIQPAAAAKRIELDVQVAARPALTSGDPNRLQQVVWNLLSNAVKFTEPEGTVTVRLERNGAYRLTVRDTGAGIEPRFLPFVFEPFRQADGTASREHGGLGLGLAIAKQLVELHGGTIQARSLGKGTGATFEVTLPSVLAPAAVSPVELASIEVAPAGGVDRDLLRHVRVLVVDDEEDARVLLETALEQYGAEVKAVSSAADALETLDQWMPDVVVSDIGMPSEDGYSLIRRVRARPSGRGGSLPALALTAYASHQDRATALAAGFQAHIAKPYEPAELAKLVQRLTREAAHG